MSLFNRPQPNYKHNKKECWSVVTSRLFGGASEDYFVAYFCDT